MTDWKQLVADHYASTYDASEMALKVRAAASTELIVATEKLLAFEFPAELRSFYLTMNGFELVPNESPDFRFNLFPPLELIPKFVTAVREVISDSHPDVGARFVPVVDFGNGDAVGYLSGADDPGLHRFDHETCGYDAKQDWEEFLFPIGARTIQEFLRL